MSDTQLKIRKVLEAHQSLQRVDKHLVDANKRLAAAEKKLETLVGFLAEKDESIKNLEGMSLKSMFHNILGSKEEQIEKERQEYLEASLKFDEATKAIELIKFEQNLLEEKLAKAPVIEQELEALKRLREQELMAHPQTASKIRNLNLQMEDRLRMRVEIQEAMDAGKQCLPLLHQMANHLRQAKNWGNWDMFSGRQRSGHMTEIMKHSNIDRAKNLSYRAQQKLIRFENELRDIYKQQNFHLSINLEAFSRFTDVFFDNLISDWIIQKQIKNALNNVVATQDKVSRICDSLEADFDRMDADLDQLEMAHEQMITG